jgi:hypothetical protein
MPLLLLLLSPGYFRFSALKARRKHADPKEERDSDKCSVLRPTANPACKYNPSGCFLLRALRRPLPAGQGRQAPTFPHVRDRHVLHLLAQSGMLLVQVVRLGRHRGLAEGSAVLRATGHGAKLCQLGRTGDRAAVGAAAARLPQAVGHWRRRLLLLLQGGDRVGHDGQTRRGARREGAQVHDIKGFRLDCKLQGGLLASTGMGLQGVGGRAGAGFQTGVAWILRMQAADHLASSAAPGTVGPWGS